LRLDEKRNIILMLFCYILYKATIKKTVEQVEATGNLLEPAVIKLTAVFCFWLLEAEIGGIF